MSTVARAVNKLLLKKINFLWIKRYRKISQEFFKVFPVLIRDLRQGANAEPSLKKEILLLLVVAASKASHTAQHRCIR